MACQRRNSATSRPRRSYVSRETGTIRDSSSRLAASAMMRGVDQLGAAPGMGGKQRDRSRGHALDPRRLAKGARLNQSQLRRDLGRKAGQGGKIDLGSEHDAFV